MYLNLNDLQKGMKAEVITTITRGDQTVAEQAIEDACQEAAGYLSARYDTAAEFGKTPESSDRCPLAVKLVRDIALYNIYNFSNPANIPPNRVKSYENAIALMKAAATEKANIPGLLRLNTAEDGTVTSSYVSYGGNDKRINHF
jgi:phage gp36-like protein